MVGNRPAEFNTGLSAYDERPDPKGPGQQGVLFRKVAPAMDQRVREHLAPEHPMGYWTGRFNAGRQYDRYNDESNWKDTRLLKGRATGMVPSELYHGTSARLKPGSQIEPGRPSNFPPGSEHGSTMDTNAEHVFATQNLHDAYRFARVAQERNGGRAAVYKVQPTSSVQTDAEDADTRGGYNTDPETGQSYAELGAFQSKKPLRVLNKVQFSKAKEAYRSQMEDEMGEEPGKYEFAEKTPAQRQMARYGW